MDIDDRSKLFRYLLSYMTDSSNIYNTKRDCLRDPLAGCNKQKDLSRKSVHRPSILSGHGRARERKKNIEAAGSDNAGGLLRGGGGGGWHLIFGGDKNVSTFI